MGNFIYLTIQIKIDDYVPISKLYYNIKKAIIKSKNKYYNFARRFNFNLDYTFDIYYSIL